MHERKDPLLEGSMTVELVWRRPVEFATRVPAQIWGRVEAGRSKPSSCHEAKSRWESGLTSTTCRRHAERVRTRCAQVFGKAGTNPVERRDRSRTQAYDAEQEELWRKHRERQDQAQLLGEQVDVHLKTLESSVDVVKPELHNDTQAADHAR